MFFVTDFDHPCTVHVEVHVNGSEQCLAKFSLDLVSPVEYLFRSLSLDDKGMHVSVKNSDCALVAVVFYSQKFSFNFKVSCFGMQATLRMFNLSSSYVLINLIFTRRGHL